MTTKAEELANQIAAGYGLKTIDEQAIARIIESYGRLVQEAAAKKLTITADEIRLHAGEMSPSEMRTVQAVLGWRMRAIREFPLP